MSEREKSSQYIDPVMSAWHGWGSPVGLGMFFVLIAVAVDLIRFAFK